MEVSQRKFHEERLSNGKSSKDKVKFYGPINDLFKQAAI